MKKITTLVLSLGMLANISVISYGEFSEETKNSIYLPRDSWVITKLEEKLAAIRYKPADDWKDKVSVNYACVYSGAPKVETMSSVLRNSQGAGLVVPLKKEDGWTPEKYSASVGFENPNAIRDIVAAVSAPEPPVEGGHCKVELGNAFSTDLGADEREMATMEREAANVPEEDFTFNAQTKMHQVSMDGYYYTFGCIFEDDQGRKLFWCRKAANEFRREKFYKLADVLNAYREYKTRRYGFSTCGI